MDIAQAHGYVMDKASMRVRLVVLFFNIGIASVLCELGLRLIGFSFPNFYMADPNTGLWLHSGPEGGNGRRGGPYIRMSGR
jgi:hypothetical protein